MQPNKALVPLLFCLLLFSNCRNEPAQKQATPVKKKIEISVKKPAAGATKQGFHYHFLSFRGKRKVKDSLWAIFKAYSPAERDIILRLNRIDAASCHRLDTMVVPDKIDTDWMAYSVFPTTLPVLKNVKKMVVFAYYPQAFAAYENGNLVRWGPTNMGRKSSPTPTGLFSANWKAKETISTVNDEWKLKWNFNVYNVGGVGWHEYQLPGYPASHSCMRLMEADAFFLYNWTDQWIVKKGLLVAQGTPVLIFGEYPYGQRKPWWHLVENPEALNIPADTLSALIQPNLDKILKRQSQRDSALAKMPNHTPDTSATK